MIKQNKIHKSLLQKILAFLLAICMVTGLMIPFTSINAFAAAPSSYTDITADSTASVSITSSGTSKYFRFVPTQSGTYRFYSDNNSGASSDTRGYLLDASGSVLTSDDDGGSNHNFLITYDCTAGVTYYIQAQMYGSDTGSYMLHVEMVAAICEHDFVNGVCVLCGKVAAFAEVATPNTAYPLFNSGRSSSASKYSSTSNYDETSFNNGNYDLYSAYGKSNIRNIRLGLSFMMNANATELAQVTIYAYDVDEGSGERDCIRLVDETSGIRTVLTNTSGKDYLSGQDETWSTTTFEIPASLLVKNHTYHFENEETVSGWIVYIRTVDLQINGLDKQPNPPSSQRGISYANISGSISASGTVMTNLVASAYTEEQFELEYKATYLEEGDQKGGATSTVTIPATQTSFVNSFNLESDAKRGTYEITVFIRFNGMLEVTKTCTASYGYSAVSYNENGGSNSKPTDTNSYSSGDTVTVKFDSVPSRYGYTFLGWSTDRYATGPMYTENGTKTFTIGSSDVTLYAVWALDVCEHEWTETSRLDATCTTYGEIIYTCSCGETRRELLEPIQHNYQITAIVEPTCTTDGYIDFSCQNAGCTATKRQVLERLGHDFGDDNVCDRCGHTIVIHTHDYVINTVAPTCTSMGYTEYTCSWGHSYRNNYVEPTRHNWDAGEVTIGVTCTTEGLMTYTCQDCGATKTALIAAGHQWSEVVTIEKTCTTDGSLTKTCSVCGKVEIEVIPAGHNWNVGVETLAATCETEGEKICTCLDCGATQTFVIPALGHEYVNGVCSRCGERFMDNITPSSHPIYGMYFEINDIISDYGPSLIDEYGVMLDYNSDAILEKVAVYLTQDGTMWRRCIAVKGTNIQYATYVPYLSYQSDIKYTGLNHDWINIFRLSENSDNIWCYSNYATIGVNLEDAYGNLLLSLYDIGQAGAETKIFDDLDEMIAWLKDDDEECIHTPSDWIIDIEPTATQTGSRHKECTVCHTVLETEVIPALAKLVIADVEAEAGSIVRVTIDIQNNPGIIGAVLTLNYDSALTLINAEAGSAWNSLNFTPPSIFSNSCNFVWDGITGADYGNGTILVLTFKLPDDADVGMVYNISVSYTYENIINADLETVYVEIEDGSITVVNTIGDVNDDGVFDVADIITLRRYLAGGYGVVIDEFAADINADGTITIADVVLLRRLLVGN